LNRGDIFRVDLEPTVGREQRGKRPVLVVSTAAFNKVSLPIVCPITGGGEAQRTAGLTVSLTTAGTQTTGVILCAQVRAVDLRARRGRLVERVPAHVIDEVLAVLQDIFE
jgi:mRNA interferase ChpB